jgi:hypothetical protein
MSTCQTGLNVYITVNRNCGREMTSQFVSRALFAEGDFKCSIFTRFGGYAFASNSMQQTANISVELLILLFRVPKASG